MMGRFVVFAAIFVQGSCKANEENCNSGANAVDSEVADNLSLLQTGIRVHSEREVGVGLDEVASIDHFPKPSTIQLPTTHGKPEHDTWKTVVFDDGDLEKAFYINVDSNIARKESMESQFRDMERSTTSGSHHIAHERFSALTPANMSDVPKWWWDHGVCKGATQHWMPDISPNGTVALPLTIPFDLSQRDMPCYMSHRALWERIADIGHGSERKWYIILEDDVTLPPGWVAALTQVLQRSELPPEWSAIRMNTWGSVRPADVVSHQGHSCVLQNNTFADGQQGCMYRNTLPYYGDGIYYYMGSHATLLTSASARRLLRHIENKPVEVPDGMLVGTPNTFVVFDEHLPYQVDY